MTETVDLAGITFLDAYGLERTPVEGRFTPEGLAARLIDEWVPFYECHKCSRSDYCKFAEPVSPGSARMREIQCGVVVTGIKNLVRVTFRHLPSFSRSQLQHYLDGVFHLTRFLFDAEIRIGSAMDDSYIDYLEDWAVPFFGRFVHLRDRLNSMAGAFKGLPKLDAEKGFLLVEGPSEKAFIERLRLSHLGWFIGIDVGTYSGKGSRGPRRLELLLSKLSSQGYRIHIQGDADGGPTNIFDGLVSRGLVDPQFTFVFPHDFETAVPHDLAHAALHHIGTLPGVDRQTYLEEISSRSGPLATRLLDAFSLDLQPIKVQFAEAVSGFINWATDWVWHRDEEFMASDLGLFLQFLRRVY
jgi:hypothetical protein